MNSGINEGAGMSLGNKFGKYRYSFQNQENDEELWEGAVSFKYRIEDPRLGRFFSVDPLTKDYEYNSSYAFSENKLGIGRELEGLELGPLYPGQYQGKHLYDANGDGKVSDEEMKIGKQFSIYLAAGTITVITAGVAAPLLLRIATVTTLNTVPQVLTYQFATAEIASFTLNLLNDSPEDLLPTPGPGGEIAKLLRSTLKSIDIAASSGKMTTILGRYSGGTKEFFDRGFKQLKSVNLLDVATKLDTKIPEQARIFWNRYNKPFLDEAIKRGDNIKLCF